MTSLIEQGYQIHRGVFGDDEIELLRQQADRIASEAGTACVRHLRDRSCVFRELSLKAKMFDLLPGQDLRPVLFHILPRPAVPVVASPLPITDWISI